MSSESPTETSLWISKATIKGFRCSETSLGCCEAPAAGLTDTSGETKTWGKNWKAGAPRQLQMFPCASCSKVTFGEIQNLQMWMIECEKETRTDEKGGGGMKKQNRRKQRSKVMAHASNCITLQLT